MPDVGVIDVWTNLVKLLNNQFTFFALIFFTFLVVLIGKREEGKRKDLLFFSILFFSGYVIMLLISLIVQPVFFIKYLQFLTIPLFFAIVSFFSVYKFEGWKRLIPFGVIIPFILSFKPVPDMNRETNELVHYIKEIKDTNTIVNYCPPHYLLTIAYYYDQTYFRDYYNTEKLMFEEGFVPIYSSQDLDIDRTVHDALIYIDFDSRLLYPKNGILEELDQELIFIQSKAFKGNFNVYLYEFGEE